MLLGPRIVSKYSQHPIARLCKLARLALLLHCSATTAHGYPFHHPGKWSKSHTWAAANYQEPAVHMVLLPGDSTHSNVLWWRGDEFTTSADFDGALLRWNPPIPAEVEPNVFPTGKIVVGFVPTPDIDIFCGGQAHLPDGRVIIMGGNETGEIGLKKATVFNPFNIASPWQSQPDMSQRRWYPTALTLPTNKTLVLSGNQYHHMDVLGGFTTGGATGDSLRRLGMASNATWDPGVVPDAYFSQRPLIPTGSRW